MTEAALNTVSLNGRVFGLGDQTFFEIATRNTPRLAPIREAVVNSVEAGATAINIFPAKDGKVIIRDDGCGMSASELIEYMGAYGSGGKERGREKNLGLGLKAVGTLLNPDGVIITSWQQGIAHRIELGRLAPGIYGVKYAGKSSETVEGAQLARDVTSPSGTEVQFRNMAFGPYQILQFLNNRFLRLPPTVQVHGGLRDQSATRRNAQGLIMSMARACKAVGQVELYSCNLHWGILPDDKDEAQRDDDHFASHEFAPHHLYLAWQGETFRSWAAYRGGERVLLNWGVRAGGKRIILVVELKGDNLAPTIDRNDVTGWDELAVQDEVASGLPEEILNYMDEYEEKHFDVQSEAALVEQILRERFAKVRLFGIDKDVLQPGGGETGDELVDTEDPPPPPPPEIPPRPPRIRRPPKRHRGRPTYVFVDREGMAGNDRCVYDPTTNRVLICNEFDPVKGLLEEAAQLPPAAQQDVRARIAAGAIFVTVEWQATKKQDPPTDVLESQVMYPGDAFTSLSAHQRRLGRQAKRVSKRS